MDPALTLHRLGVASKMGVSLRTTNIIEHINSHLGERTRRGKRWMNSDQRQCRVATAIGETEPRLKALRCAAQSTLLSSQEALSECVSKQHY